MNTIKFLSYKYKIDTESELANINCADKFLEEGIYHPIVDNQCVTLIIEKFFVNSNICYWIYVLTGEKSPYNPEVIDSENDFRNIPNPRPRKLVEQNQQYFGILIPKEVTLFSSNKKLNKLLQLYYKESFSQGMIDISPDIVNKQEFEKILRSITEMKLKYKQPKQSDFFTMPSEADLIEMAKKTLDGLPTDDFSEIEFGLDIKFKEKNTLNNFFWNFLKKDEINPALKKLYFVGNTYNDFDIIFNTENFQHKIDIKASKDNNGMYNKDSVKEELKCKIGNFTMAF
ncbi:hypothetical protein [Bartonella harrusi]|uniref:DUF3883 domain-containing protein n=1 Tax=Bartonella harrusi TaxID=2961895 RepID=A0ABY5ERB7_9HYPH|nr:hypothetical protein [Bartonella harrusi]UTO27822.1 hypothetical protein NMK50_06130 [Bartonella harrusi]